MKFLPLLSFLFVAASARAEIVTLLFNDTLEVDKDELVEIISVGSTDTTVTFTVDLREINYPIGSAGPAITPSNPVVIAGPARIGLPPISSNFENRSFVTLRLWDIREYEAELSARRLLNLLRDDSRGRSRGY